MVLARHQAALFVDADVSRIGQLRSEVGASYLAFVVKAVSRTLPEFPCLNVSACDGRALPCEDVHLALALAGCREPRIPLISRAQRKSLLDIARDIARLSELVRLGSVPPLREGDATFTVWNPGGFGVLLSVPPIAGLQSAAMGVGRVAKAPVVRGDEIGVGEVMHLSLAYDSPSVPEDTAGQFLWKIKRLLEDAVPLLDMDPWHGNTDGPSG